MPPLLLEPEAPNLLEEQLARSTRDAYEWAWDVFTSWCEEHGCAAMPAAVETWKAFLEDTIARRGLSYASLAQVKSAVKRAHVEEGKLSPTDTPRGKGLWRAVRRVVTVAPKRPVEPLTLDVLEAMLARVDRRTLVGQRDAAVLTLAFHVAARRSELAALRIEDIRETRGGIVVRVRSSKTDPHGSGEFVGVQRDPAGGPLCAVGAFGRWLQASGITSGKLFRGFDVKGRLTETFSGRTVARIVKRYVQAAEGEIKRLAPALTKVRDLASRFSGHSARAGFVTTAYRHGASEAAIMATTRHASVASLMRYRREADPLARGASSAIWRPRRPGEAVP